MHGGLQWLAHGLLRSFAAAWQPAPNLLHLNRCMKIVFLALQATSMHMPPPGRTRSRGGAGAQPGAVGRYRRPHYSRRRIPVFLRLLGERGFKKLSEFVLSKPTFGTCAGCILLARQIENPAQAGVGALDITVRRNAYGRQIDSAILARAQPSWRAALWSRFISRAAYRTRRPGGGGAGRA